MARVARGLPHPQPPLLWGYKTFYFKFKIPLATLATLATHKELYTLADTVPCFTLCRQLNQVRSGVAQLVGLNVHAIDIIDTVLYYCKTLSRHVTRIVQVRDASVLKIH